MEDRFDPEISDLIISYDPETLARRPVRKDDVLRIFKARANRRAVRVVESLPAVDGVLDPDAVDRALLRSHAELQRLSEEFQQGQRIRMLLAPMLQAARAAGIRGPIRVVDVGCGLGFVVRWLAARGGLGPEVDLLGCDYNAALLGAARAAAAAEALPCSFRLGNAFALPPGADGREVPTIYYSTGVIHHFRGSDLTEFLGAQSNALGFLHFDIQPTWLAPIGVWIFHIARMREPLAWHDGVLSALRAHPDADLFAAAREGCPGLAVTVFDKARGPAPILRVLRPLIGLRRDLVGAFVDALGPLRRRLEPFPAPHAPEAS